MAYDRVRKKPKKEASLLASFLGMVSGAVSLRDIFQRASACPHPKEEYKRNAQGKEDANDGENCSHIATEHASGTADAYHNHGDDFLENRNG